MSLKSLDAITCFKILPLILVAGHNGKSAVTGYHISIIYGHRHHEDIVVMHDSYIMIDTGQPIRMAFVWLRDYYNGICDTLYLLHKYVLRQLTMDLLPIL